MSGVVCYASIVAGELHCTWEQALDAPVVVGNHAIAMHYERKEIKWRFAGAKAAR